MADGSHKIVELLKIPAAGYWKRSVLNISDSVATD